MSLDSQDKNWTKDGFRQTLDKHRTCTQIQTLSNLCPVPKMNPETHLKVDKVWTKSGLGQTLYFVQPLSCRKKEPRNTSQGGQRLDKVWTWTNSGLCPTFVLSQKLTQKHISRWTKSGQSLDFDKLWTPGNFFLSHTIPKIVQYSRKFSNTKEWMKNGYVQGSPRPTACPVNVHVLSWLGQIRKHKRKNKKWLRSGAPTAHGPPGERPCPRLIWQNSQT